MTPGTYMREGCITDAALSFTLFNIIIWLPICYFRFFGLNLRLVSLVYLMVSCTLCRLLPLAGSVTGRVCLAICLYTILIRICQ